MFHRDNDNFDLSFIEQKKNEDGSKICDDVHAAWFFDGEFSTSRAKNKWQINKQKYLSDTDQYHDFSSRAKHTTSYVVSLYVYIHLKQNVKNPSVKYDDHPFTRWLLKDVILFTFIWIKSRNFLLSREYHTRFYSRSWTLNTYTHRAHTYLFLRTRSWKSLNNNLLSIIFDLLIYYYESAS